MKTPVYLLICAIYAAPHMSKILALVASAGFLVLAIASHFSDKGAKQ